MKLGLICLVTVTALVMQVSAQVYYMASVFILGVNVGEQKYDKNAKNKVEETDVEEFNLRYGSIRFRLLVFRTYTLDYKSSPTNDKAVWDIISITDFDISFKQLNKEFSTGFLEELKIDCKFHTEGLGDETIITQQMTGSSFKIKRYFSTFKTEDTHVASLITNFDLSKDVKFSVFAKDKLEIHFHKEEKPLQGSIIDFNIGPIVNYEDTCKKSTTNAKFLMKSEEIKDTKGGPVEEMWRGGKHKIHSSFYVNQNDYNNYIRFKINTVKILVSAILVVDHIPLKRVYINTDSTLNIEHKIPFQVIALGPHNGTYIYSNDFKRRSGTWSLFDGHTIDYNTHSFYSEKPLFSQRQIEEQAVSLTLNFQCLTRII